MPEHISIQHVIDALETFSGVSNVHHVHVWQLDEHENALEAHVVFDDLGATETIKVALKAALAQRFDITHSTLEFEAAYCEKECRRDSGQT